MASVALRCRYEPFVVAQTCVDVTIPAIGHKSSGEEAEQSEQSAKSQAECMCSLDSIRCRSKQQPAEDCSWVACAV